MARTRPWDVSARASPSALDASSTVPNASIRGSSFGARPPPRRPVVPSSPVPDRSSIRFRRGPLLDEDPGELVQLLGHAAGLLDDLGDGHDLDVPVAPDRDHAALALDDQLHRGDAEPGRPDPVHRRRRAAALEVSEHGHPSFETGLVLDRARKNVADAALGEPDVAEGILFRISALLPLELGNMRAFGDDDDAEQLALPAPAIEMGDHLGEADLKLGNDDEVGAAGDPTHQRHPPRLSSHGLDA